jgi:hypothetical protein
LAGDWSPDEVAATVADYFVMLGHELRGEPYNKREHNRKLQLQLNARSAGAIEFKHANISAILIELGYPYVDGYKPRSNYQDLLKDEVLSRLGQDHSIALAAQHIVDAPVTSLPGIRELEEVFIPIPTRERAPGTYERRVPLIQPIRGVNYLEREARNAALGAAGEQFVLDVEHRRLWSSGQRKLAERIEHVSRTRGDGLGYDIISFETDGRERLVEVKTTAFGSMTPFFASAREVSTSEAHSERYHLYRVIKFRSAPRIFTLPGSLRESCILDAVEYRATMF